MGRAGVGLRQRFLLSLALCVAVSDEIFVCVSNVVIPFGFQYIFNYSQSSNSHGDESYPETLVGYVHISRPINHYGNPVSRSLYHHGSP